MSGCHYILIMHLAYYNNSIDKVDSYVNGANIEFLLHLFGGPINTTNLIRIGHNSKELKWVDIGISGYWIFNLSMPENMTRIYESWKAYKYSDFESNITKKPSFLEEENEYNFMHILLYQKRQDKDEFGNLERTTYIRNALKEYDLKNKMDVEYILNITYCAFRGQYYQQFFNDLFEVIAQEYG